MGELSVRMVVPMPMKNLFMASAPAPCISERPSSYPNVAADPSIYCPNVRIMPLAPGPYRMMLVAPKMNPMMRPTAVGKCASQSLWFRQGGWREGQADGRTGTHHGAHLHCVTVSVGWHGLGHRRLCGFTFVEGGWATHPTGCCYWRHIVWAGREGG
jgi:hypothetical protein